MKNKTVFLSLLFFLAICAGKVFGEALPAVEGIMMGNGEPVAIVNGQMVRENDAVEGFRIVKIEKGFVTFLASDGETFHVPLASIKRSASSVQEPSGEQKKLSFWEKVAGFFSGKKKGTQKQQPSVKKDQPFQDYLARAQTAQKRAKQVAAEQQRRVDEMEGRQDGSSDVGGTKSKDYISQRIDEAQRILQQADGVQKGTVITAQFFKEKLSLYDEAERKLEDALSGTTDAQKRLEIRDVLQDVRDKKTALRRGKEDFDRQIRKAIELKKLMIGMTKADAKNAIGLPDAATKRRQGGTLFEVWYYQERFGNPAAEAYFDRDILVNARSK